MRLGEILDQVRAYYLKRFVEATRKYSKDEIETEAALRNKTGELQCDGRFALPVRVDILVGSKSKMNESITIDTERMLSFEPIEFPWEEQLQVSLRPFQWNWIRVSIPEKRNVDWKPVVEWFWKWFDKDDCNKPDKDGLFGVVHFLSDPKTEGNKNVVFIDFGTSPVTALEEFLDAVVKTGANEVTIGNE